MEDGWDKFWNFIGIAFWVVLIGWFGISLFTPKSSADTSSESNYSDTYESADEYDASYDSYDYSEDYDAEYEEPTPSYYRSSYSSSYDKDCSDFGSWSEAQDYYENVADDNLDGDGDGVACESLD